MEKESVQVRADRRAGYSRDYPLLSVRNLKTYFFQDEGTVRAVDGATFDIHVGRTIGVVGESGCGKSVTARSILRLIEKHGRIVDGSIIYRQGFGTNGPQCHRLRDALHPRR